MRLIDADELYDAISDNWSGIWVASISDILNFINETDRLDPVHAAGACYCRECKNEISTPQMRESTGQYWCKYKLQPCNADDFCSYGKQKEETE